MNLIKFYFIHTIQKFCFFFYGLTEFQQESTKS